MKDKKIIQATIEYIIDSFDLIDWQDTTDELFENICNETKDELEYSSDDEIIIINMVHIIGNFLRSFENEITYNEVIEEIESFENKLTYNEMIEEIESFKIKNKTEQ